MRYEETIHYLTNQITIMCRNENESCPRLKVLKILLLSEVKHYLETNNLLFNAPGFYYNGSFIDHKSIYHQFKFFASYDLKYNEKSEFKINDELLSFIDKNHYFLRKLIKLKPWELNKYHSDICLNNINLKYDKEIDENDIKSMSLNMSRVGV